MATKVYVMDQGEYLKIPVRDQGSGPPWDDLSAATVTMRLRRSGSPPEPVVPGFLDAPGADGKVKGAYAVVPFTTIAGRYDGELELAAPGAGWPQILPFVLKIRPRRAV